MNVKTLTALILGSMMAVTMGCQARENASQQIAGFKKASLIRPSEVRADLQLYALIPSQKSKAIAFSGYFQDQGIVELEPQDASIDPRALKIKIQDSNGNDAKWEHVGDLRWRGILQHSQIYYLQVTNGEDKPVPVKIKVRIMPARETQS